MPDQAHPGPGRVRLADRVVSLSAVRDRPAEYARAFAAAKAEAGHAACLCRTPPLRLVIRCTRAGRYHLAGWPGEGDLHADGCAFHKLHPPVSGRTGYTREAIQDTDHGPALRIQPALTRQLAEPHRAAPDRVAPPTHGRSSVSLLGLLHWLWEQAQLACWDPRWRHRGWGLCHARLRDQADGCAVNGQDLAQLLYVVPPYRPASAEIAARVFQAFLARLGQRHGAVQRGLVLGEVKDVAATPYGVRYRLSHLRDGLFASQALHQRASRSYRPAFPNTEKAGTRRIALFVIELSPRGYLQVIDLAAMLCSQLYIPADSGFEAHMANQLAAAGRAFIKPLRYDAAEAVLPDFLLTDVTPWHVVEVYGIRGQEAYERRKRAKQALYRQRSVPLLEWDVDGPMPELGRPADARGSAHPHSPRQVR